MKAMIVGEHLTQQDLDTDRAFSGGEGQVLYDLLNQVGIPAGECFVTHALKLVPPGNKFLTLTGPASEALPGYPELTRGRYIKRSYLYELKRLDQEIEEQQPNIIIALGNLALWATAKTTGINENRGSIIRTISKRKVLATFSPGAVLRQWKLRPVMAMDLLKAKRHMDDPNIPQPGGTVIMEPCLEDIKTFYNEHVRKAPFITCDIETQANTITMVGFATSAENAIVIPFYRIPNRNYWPTAEAEKEAWEWVQTYLDAAPVVGQNFAYDMKYLWTQMGITCESYLGDTMLLHHAMHPELKKGLGFLGSLYTERPIWKQLRKGDKTAKKGD